jgi:hypothetical protein
MFHHIVMYWLKDRDNQALMQETLDKLNSMEGKIPGLLRVKARKDEAGDARSCDLCLVTVLESREAFQAYKAHPVHLPVKEHMHRVVERSASADFEEPQG